MATEKKYLDLQGLQHLKEQKVLVKHPSDPAASAAAARGKGEYPCGALRPRRRCSAHGWPSGS